MRLVPFARLVGFYARELVEANLVLAREVLTVRSGSNPAVVRIPVSGRSPKQVTLLAHLLSLLPGTLAIDVSDDHTLIYVHALHASDTEALRRRVQDLEQRTMEALW